jgi:hypothetical protein
MNVAMALSAVGLRLRELRAFIRVIPGRRASVIGVSGGLKAIWIGVPWTRSRRCGRRHRRLQDIRNVRRMDRYWW